MINPSWILKLFAPGWCENASSTTLSRLKETSFKVDLSYHVAYLNFVAAFLSNCYFELDFVQSRVDIKKKKRP